jgi:hypothetical protein
MTAMNMKNGVFWDMKPCSPVEIYLHFGELYCSHLHCTLKMRVVGYSEMSSAPRFFNEVIIIFLFIEFRIVR